jgi:hypothetical protein
VTANGLPPREGQHLAGAQSHGLGAIWESKDSVGLALGENDLKPTRQWRQQLLISIDDSEMTNQIQKFSEKSPKSVECLSKPANRVWAIAQQENQIPKKSRAYLNSIHIFSSDTSWKCRLSMLYSCAWDVPLFRLTPSNRAMLLSGIFWLLSSVPD